MCQSQFDFAWAHSLRFIRTNVSAAQSDGLQHGEIDVMAGLACDGKSLGNIEREVARRMEKLLNINVEPYEVKVHIDADTIVKVNVILPHELSAVLWWKFPDVVVHRMLGPDGVREFWQIAADSDEPFFRHHPMRENIWTDMNSYIPIRV